MKYLMSFVCVLALPHPMINKNIGKQTRKSVSVVSKRVIKETRRAYGEAIPHETTPGAIARNEMDTHADTCCAGANWKLMEMTNEVCEVTPFWTVTHPSRKS